MPSSTSSSERPSVAAPEAPSYFVRGLMMVAFSLGLALIVGHAAGRIYHPQPLGVSRADVTSAEHVIVALGNSRFYSSIAYDRLAQELSEPGNRVNVVEFSGGGWDSLHYYMLALLSRDALRPGKDAVLIEVSPLSENDSDSHNKLGAIRPEVATRLAAVPGLPLEARLDILTGAIAGLYRYRTEIQNQIIGAQMERAAARVSPVLLRTGMLRPEFRKPPFEVITIPGRNYVVKDVRGDVTAFRTAMRVEVARSLTTLEFGGYKFNALELAIRSLSERGIDVFLVQTPTSKWLSDSLNATEAGERYRQKMPELAHRTGAVFLSDWPPQFLDQGRFRDDMHMYGEDRGINPFTDLLADELKRRKFLRAQRTQSLGAPSRNANRDPDSSD